MRVYSSYPSSLLLCHLSDITTDPVPIKKFWLICLNGYGKSPRIKKMRPHEKHRTKPCAWLMGLTWCLHIFSLSVNNFITRDYIICRVRVSEQQHLHWVHALNLEWNGYTSLFKCVSKTLRCSKVSLKYKTQHVFIPVKTILWVQRQSVLFFFWFMF